MTLRSKITTITGFDAPISDAPALEIDNGMARYVWIEAHMKSTYRAGHWNMGSAQKIADKLGIVDGLEIKHLN